MDNKPFYWLNDKSKQFLQNGYLSPGETAESRLRDIADHAEKLLGIKGYSDKFFDYLSRGFYSLSSPVWSNFGKERGMPVSCFGSYVHDSVVGILKAQSEIGVMSKLGGGTACYMGEVRPRGSDITDNGKSTGAVHFLELFQATTDVISQGSTRRGRTSPYMPIDHGDIEEFLDIGTEGHPIQTMLHAVTITDEWMDSMIEGDQEKRKIWAKVLKRRSEMGYPYIMFVDAANEGAPDVYKDKDMKILHSQLCSEIMLPTNADESFTCVLSSMNILHYDEWKDTDAVETMIYFLDAVVTEFLTKLEIYRDSEDEDKRLIFQNMERAYRFTKRHRALGLGTLGWHSYLQSKMIPFESKEAAKLNVEIHQVVQERSYAASQELASIFGEPEVLKGYGRRNTTLNAIAPTTSSAFILGQVSQSIEPVMQNCYVKDLAKIKTVIKNPFLEKLLDEKGVNEKYVWDNIIANDGSVFGLPDHILSPEEKDVFKKFSEIDPMAVLSQAAARQPKVDQAQSLNLNLDEGMTPKEINHLYITAWKMRLKTLYYQHSVNQSQVFARNKRSECVACEA